MNLVEHTLSRPAVMVLGASANKERYSYLAVKRLLDHGYTVFPVGLTGGQIGTFNILSPDLDFDIIDTVSVYLNPRNQSNLLELLTRVKPRRVIFNPGAENEVLQQQLVKQGMDVQEACTLVLLSTGQFEC